MTTANETTNATILAILKQMVSDAKNCARESSEAVAQMELGKRESAIGALLAIDREIDRLGSLKAAVLALHRS